MELKKSYKGFVIWLIAYMVLLLGVCFLPVEDVGILTCAITGMTAVAMAVLTWIIWKTEYVYWYTGMTYEEAVAAGQERRRAYAWKHFVRFGWTAAGMLVFSAAAQALGVPFWADLIVCGVGIVAVAVSTMNIRL